MRSTLLWPIARLFAGFLALIIAAVSLVQMESARQGLDIEQLELAGTPATLYRSADAEADPLVLVAHGFAGSRQMMSAISLTLARSGFTVVAFDFIGHGRHTDRLTPDVTAIDGTTAQLVAQTGAVAEEARALSAAAPPISLVGHSMATDVIIRAAKAIDDTAAIVAISMYSEAITPSYPERLLVISGAWEDRLREAGLAAVRQLAPEAEEGETVRANGVVRRTLAAPHVEHVGVLYSPVTLAEARTWIAEATGQPFSRESARTGPWISALLGAILLAAWPLASMLGPARAPEPRLSGSRLALLGIAPVLPALAVGAFVDLPVIGLHGFGRLAAFFAAFGFVQLALLWRTGIRPETPRAWAGGALLVWSLVFALALDRYGAAFLPVGPRFVALMALALGTVPFLLADRLIAARTRIWQRWVLRTVPLATLSMAMLAAPTSLGLMFTVLPVYLLFFLVYGSMGGWVATRSNPTTAGLALGVVLAWSIAASTPLFSA